MLTVSLFIRARNEAATLDRTLCAIRAGRRIPDQVVVLDNESDDDTALIAARSDAVVRSISRSQFTYGAALNRALEFTEGQVIVFLSAHSPPLDERWLDSLIRPIESGEASATFGRQVPESGVNPFEEWIVYRTFPRCPRKWKAMLGLQKITFSAANAAVLTSSLRQYPFREDLAFAEDIEWAARVRGSGHRLTYCPEAAVYHSHRFEPGELEKRMRAVGRSMRQQGGGSWYRNGVVCRLVHLAAMTVDLLYCVSRGYWRPIRQIHAYRRAYFRGLRAGIGGAPTTKIT